MLYDCFMLDSTGKIQKELEWSKKIQNVLKALLGLPKMVPNGAVINEFLRLDDSTTKLEWSL